MSKKNTVIFSNKTNVKPLSVNQAWQGRRFKSKAYTAYETYLLQTLPDTDVSWADDKIELELNIGFSNVASDLDNAVKPFVDILQKKYKFNDKNIYRLVVEKQIVKRGEDFIEFAIRKISFKKS